MPAVRPQTAQHALQRKTAVFKEQTAFLPAGTYSVEIFRDGPNATRAARDYVRELQTVRVDAAQHTLKAAMAPGGGWTAKFTRVGE